MPVAEFSAVSQYSPVDCGIKFVYTFRLRWLLLSRERDLTGLVKQMPPLEFLF